MSDDTLDGGILDSLFIMTKTIYFIIYNAFTDSEARSRICMISS